LKTEQCDADLQNGLKVRFGRVPQVNDRPPVQAGSGLETGGVPTGPGFLES
jgi:hypothetical protein